MKTTKNTLGYIAIMRVNGENIVVGLPCSPNTADTIMRLIRDYSAVVIDMRDIWIN